MKNVLRSSALLFCAAFLSSAAVPAFAQSEGALRTQVLVNVDRKSQPPASASDLTIEVNGHKQPLTSWTPVVPTHAQVALLIDDGLRESVGRELNDLRAFVQSLPRGTEVLVGYMENGRVIQAQPFTTDTESAAAALRLPTGLPGISASPYLCLSDFVRHWPDEQPAAPNAAPTIDRDTGKPQSRARFVLMISNGVDPYNGSTSITNETSPYVDAAIRDAQRAGVAVYTIYFTDAGFRGPRASFSGQTYLQMLSDGTGGENYFEGIGNPVSMQPFFDSFKRALSRTYIATFDAPAGKDPSRDLVRIKLSSAKKAKFHLQDQVLPGNAE